MPSQPEKPERLEPTKKPDASLTTSPYRTATVLFFTALFLAICLAVLVQLGLVNSPLANPLDEPMPASLATLAHWQAEHAELIASLTPNQQALLDHYGKRWQNEQVRQDFLTTHGASTGQHNLGFKPARTLGEALYQQQTYEQRYPNNPTALLGFDKNQPVHLSVLPAEQQNPASGYLWLRVTNLSTDTWHSMQGELTLQANVELTLPTQQFVPPLAPASTGLIRGQIQYPPHSPHASSAKQANTQHATDLPSTNFAHPLTDLITALLKKPLAGESAQTAPAPLSIQCQPCTVYDDKGNEQIYELNMTQSMRE